MSEVESKEPRSLESLVGALVTSIEKGPPGDAAALRRLDPAHPWCGPFWKLSAAFLSDDRRLSEDEERRWAVLMSVFAHCGSLHRFGRDHAVGRVLANIDFSELRFTRLLRAEGDALLKEAALLGRLLSAKAQPVDLTGVAQLVLSDGRSNAERERRSLARDYYAAVRKAD